MECDGDGIVPIRLKALMDEPEEPDSVSTSDATKSVPDKDVEEHRNGYEALEAAVRDLIRLERHEQRAWSRQKRAILELANFKLARRFSGAAQSCGDRWRDEGANCEQPPRYGLFGLAVGASQ